MNLARQIFGDGLDRGVDARGVRVAQQHVVPAERAHVRDAITHLPGAYDADRGNLAHINRHRRSRAAECNCCCSAAW